MGSIGAPGALLALRRRWWVVPLLGILLLSAWLRFTDLGEIPGYDGDEAGIATMARAIVEEGARPLRGAQNYNGPLLPYLVAGSFALHGLGAGPPAPPVVGSYADTSPELGGVAGERSAPAYLAEMRGRIAAQRAVSAWAGVGGVAATYLLGRALLSPALGLMSALLLAVTPWHVACSRIGYDCSLNSALAILSLVLAVYGAIRGWPVLWYGAGLTLGLAMQGHLFLAFLFPTVGVWLVLDSQRRRRLVSPHFWLGYGVVALTLVPLALFNLDAGWETARTFSGSSHLDRLREGDVGSFLTTPLALLWTAAASLAGDYFWVDAYPALAGLGNYLLLAATGAAVAWVLWHSWRSAWRPAVSLVPVWLGVALLTVPLVSKQYDYAWLNFTLAVTPAHYLDTVYPAPLLALGAALLALASPLSPRWRRGVLASTTFLLVAASLLFLQEHYFDQWRREGGMGRWQTGSVEAIALLEERAPGGSLVLTSAHERRAEKLRALTTGYRLAEVEPPFSVAAQGDRRAFYLTPQRSDVPVGEPLAVSRLPDGRPAWYLFLVSSPLSLTPPSFQRGHDGLLGDVLRLVGYDLPGPPPGPGGVLHVRLHWQVLAPLAADYTAFTHLLDGQGRRRGQWDGDPLGGRFATTRWPVGLYVSEERKVLVDQDAAAGDHRLELGFYEWPTRRRLGAGSVDHLVLAPIAVEK